MSLDDLVRNYNDSVREAVDKHSLVRTKVVTLRQNTFTCHVQACVVANQTQSPSSDFQREM